MDTSTTIRELYIKRTKVRANLFANVWVNYAYIAPKTALLRASLSESAHFSHYLSMI